MKLNSSRITTMLVRRKMHFEMSLYSILWREFSSDWKTGPHIRIVLYLSELPEAQKAATILNKALFSNWLKSSFCQVSHLDTVTFLTSNLHYWIFLWLQASLTELDKLNTADFNMKKHLSFFITFSLQKYSKAWFYFSASEDRVNRTLISQTRHICTFLALWEAVAFKKWNRFPFIPLHLIFEITFQN